jgi:hypothetical protein
MFHHGLLIRSHQDRHRDPAGSPPSDHPTRRGQSDHTPAPGGAKLRPRSGSVGT